MGPRKGLSFDEKRERLQDLFTETADFFTLKELEKIASKRKGIVSQSVKEVLQSLVDDDLVNTDKCGVQTVFWCLPSERSQKRKAHLAQLRADLAGKAAQERRVLGDIAAAKAGREPGTQRAELLHAVRAKEDRLHAVEAELARFAEFDPEDMRKLAENVHAVRAGTNRWVDNVFNCQSWAARQFGMEKREFDRQFGIPEELDYVEE